MITAKKLVPLLSMFSCAGLLGYGLPYVNLGLSSFLDGGPLRPQPGFYWQEYGYYYRANRFLDGHGKKITATGPSIHLTRYAAVTQFIYQFEQNLVPNAEAGIDGSLTTVFASRTSRNTLGIRDSGGGVGNLFLGTYLQFKSRFRNNRPKFVHRLEFSAAFPVGKNKEPLRSINPGNAFFFIDPYWAFTYYFTPTLATSWRIHYLWCAKNHKTHIKAGDAIHFNYTLEHAVLPYLWIGINGYFLQQLRNNRLDGIEIPYSRERVLAVGVGALTALEADYSFVLFTNLYVECAVRNRPQGMILCCTYLNIFKRRSYGNVYYISACNDWIWHFIAYVPNRAKSSY